MPALHPQQRLNSQSDRQVESRLRVLEVESGDLADAIEPVAQRVGVDAEAMRGVLLLAGFEVRAQGCDERAFSRAVVLDQRTEVPPAVVDEPLVAHRGEKARQPKLGHSDDLR